MPRIRFDRRKAEAVDLGQAVERRETHFADDRAGCFQMLQRRVDRGGDRRFDALGDEVGQHAEAHAFERPGGRDARFEARQHPVDQRAARNRHADRAERIERRSRAARRLAWGCARRSA